MRARYWDVCRRVCVFDVLSLSFVIKVEKKKELIGDRPAGQKGAKKIGECAI